MNGNEINLFKRRFVDGNITEAYNGDRCWGNYVERAQDWTGLGLTWELTDYGCAAWFLEEVYHGR